MSGRPIAPHPAGRTNPQSAESQPTNIEVPLSGGSQTQAAGVPAGRVVVGGSTHSLYRKKVTSACQGCQKRRVKCDGTLPCSTCARTGTECSYARELDGRSIKRKYHEVQRDQDLLHDLIDTIRASDDKYVSQIISLIRSNASIDDVKASVASQLIELKAAGRERSTEFTQLQSGLNQLQSRDDQQSRAAQRADVLEIRRLTDQPLYEVRAKPWTTVTDDDNLVSNLISIWLTWDKGWHDLVDRELFIRDMQAGSLDSSFCSPFLVNCILAWACPYSDYRETRTTNGAPSRLMLDFIAEAKRLLENETHDYEYLTMTAGLLVLHGSHVVSGTDIAYRYMLQAMGMVRELISSPLAAKSQKNTSEARDLSDAINRLCWAAYIITTGVLTSLMKPQQLEPPRRSRPEPSAQDAAFRVWTPYPFSDEPFISYSDELFDWGCDLAIIEAALSRILFDTVDSVSREERERLKLTLYHDLMWRVDRLSQQLDYTTAPRTCPSLYTHHARIQVVILRLFLDLRNAVPGASPDVVTMAKSKCIEAALKIARVVKSYTDAWGASQISAVMTQPVILSFVTLLEEPDTSIYFPEITDLCIALRAMSRRWPLCMGALRTIQLDARRKGLILPPQTGKLLEDFEDSAWRQRELKTLTTMYPLPDTSKNGIVTGHEVDMGKFLEAMDNLELQESAADTKPS